MGGKRLILIVALALLLVVFGCSKNAAPSKTLSLGNTKEEATSKLNEYYSGMDYSCSTDSDCAVSDVHNCCDKFMQCVNKQAKTEPDLVTRLCKEEGAASFCSATTQSNSCKCQSSRCTSS